jgi:hypothetical protein
LVRFFVNDTIIITTWKCSFSSNNDIFILYCVRRDEMLKVSFILWQMQTCYYYVFVYSHKLFGPALLRRRSISEKIVIVMLSYWNRSRIREREIYYDILHNTHGSWKSCYVFLISLLQQLFAERSLLFFANRNDLYDDKYDDDDAKVLEIFEKEKWRNNASESLGIFFYRQAQFPCNFSIFKANMNEVVIKSRQNVFFRLNVEKVWFYRHKII